MVCHLTQFVTILSLCICVTSCNMQSNYIFDIDMCKIITLYVSNQKFLCYLCMDILLMNKFGTMRRLMTYFLAIIFLASAALDVTAQNATRRALQCAVPQYECWTSQ